VTEREPWKEDLYRLENKVDNLLRENAELKAQHERLEARLDKGASLTAKDALTKANEVERVVLELKHMLDKADMAYESDKVQFQTELRGEIKAVDTKYGWLSSMKSIVSMVIVAGALVTTAAYLTTKMWDHIFSSKQPQIVERTKR